jgi:hypothetical protein
MSTTSLRNTLIALGVVVFAGVASSCAVTAGGGYYGTDVGVGLDYYEPYGGYYGGWGSGYYVGPYRHDHHDDRGHDAHGGGRPTQHSYRPAPQSRSVPSIPSRSRGSSGGSRRH